MGPAKSRSGIRRLLFCTSLPAEHGVRSFFGWSICCSNRTFPTKPKPASGAELFPGSRRTDAEALTRNRPGRNPGGAAALVLQRNEGPEMFRQKPKSIGQVVLIPIDEIAPSPHQPREVFDRAGIDELSRSIAQNGLLVPVSVRVCETGGYILIAGERTLLACRNLGLTEIPAVILERSEADAAVLTLIENLHRENLDCFEEARGIAELLRCSGLTQSRVCAILGKSQPAVANKLRLLRLPEAVVEEARRAGLGERICRCLLALEKEPDKQLAACRNIIRRRLSADRAEAYIASLSRKASLAGRKPGVLCDGRLIFSTVDKAVAEIRRSGLMVKTEKKEEGAYIYYTIRVRKDSKTSSVSMRRQKAAG